MFEFKTKEEYLEYRSEWKEKYARLSKSLRIYRQCCNANLTIWNKAMLMAFGSGGRDYYEKMSKAFDIHKVLLTEKTENHKKLESFIASNEYVKGSSADATAMLEELKEAKLESQRQYLEQKKMQVA